MTVPRLQNICLPLTLPRTCTHGELKLKSEREIKLNYAKSAIFIGICTKLEEREINKILAHELICIGRERERERQFQVVDILTMALRLKEM